MESSRATVIRGDLLVSNLGFMVNGLLSVAYPYLRSSLTASPLVFIPETADGALFTGAGLRDVAPADTLDARAELQTASDGRLLGMPMLLIGLRVSFEVASVYLTVGRQERGPIRPGAHADFELVHWDDDPDLLEYTRWLARTSEQVTFAATAEHVSRLRPATWRNKEAT